MNKNGARWRSPKRPPIHPIPVFISGKTYDIRGLSQKTKLDARLEERDTRYVFERFVGKVALFKHLKGGYTETFPIQDIRDKKLKIKEV